MLNFQNPSSLTLTRPFQFGQIACNSVIRLLVKYVLMMVMVMVWYLGHFGRISFYKKSKKAEKVKMKEKLTEPYLTSRFHRLLENVYSMLKLCSHIVFTMFLAFLTCDITQCQRYKNCYQNCHSNANHYQFIVDATVGFPCKIGKRKLVNGMKWV